MTRKYIDCREAPSVSGCSVSIAADSEDELLEAAVQHARSVHHEEDTPELRAEIRRVMHEEVPPRAGQHFDTESELHGRH